MTTYVTSADGTRIAYERAGSGDPVILVAGLLCDRRALRDLAESLAREFSVITYDRRGRGESGDTAPYAVDREIDDLRALIAAAGGAAAVYGHSSGAGLALNAAARNLPVARLVLHEPPYGSGDGESRQTARALAESVRAALAMDRRSEAIRLFFAAAGLPAEVVDGQSRHVGNHALAHTMVYDFEVMGEFDGGAIPEDLVRAITIPTLVMAGAASPDFFRETAVRIADLLPYGRFTLLEGAGHDVRGDVVAPVVAEFISGGRAPLAASPRGDGGSR